MVRLVVVVRITAQALEAMVGPGITAQAAAVVAAALQAVVSVDLEELALLLFTRCPTPNEVTHETGIC